MPAPALLPQFSPTEQTAEIIPLPGRQKPRAAGKPAKANFTKANVAKMAHVPDPSNPKKRETVFWDASCKGFGLRALATGKRSWFFWYRDGRNQHRIALGDMTVVSLDDARAAARQHGGSVIQGGNPSAERQGKRQAAKLGDVIKEYLEYAEQKQKPRSYVETKRHLDKHAKSMHHQRTPVERAVIARWVDRVTVGHGPIAANRARAALSAMYTWGMKTGRIGGEANPIAFTLKHSEVSRERVMNDAEIKAIWTATESDHDYDRIVRLCLLTGCRRDEVGALRWDEVGDEWITISAQRMKGKSAHEVPLLPAIAALLPERPTEANEGNAVFGRHRGKETKKGMEGKKGTGFSGWSKGKRELDAKLTKAGRGVSDWGLHDLRRTMSTKLHDAGTAPHVVEELLSHKQQGVAAVYNRASFRVAKREALATWHAMLEGIVGKVAP